MNRPASRLSGAAAFIIGIAACTAAFAQTPATAPAARCTDCGVVQSVRANEVKGSTSGVGMVAGGVLGGVLGHQIGSGRGNTVATVAGAAGGAYVGNKVEQNRNTKSQWSVGIKMDSGQQRTFIYSNAPTVREGDRVKLIDGGKRLALVAP
ncbi:MAG: glycine zipper 2TM domain-containing protein [Casimicrobiaceae bacterium]